MRTIMARRRLRGAGVAVPEFPTTALIWPVGDAVARSAGRPRSIMSNSFI
jgi:hypothetical protein